jgi:ribosomal protein S18 acetylase RimI-like enzyme
LNPPHQPRNAIASPPGLQPSSGKDIHIRVYRPDELAELKRLTMEGFEGNAIDQKVEDLCGIINGHDWRWRKARHVDEDVAANPSGIFVAETQGRVVGCITTRIDREAGKGRIPNLAVDEAWRGHGWGRRLIGHALDYFRREGMIYAMIETMAQNEAGQHLYPSCGFVEVARQVHFALKL